MSNHNTALQTNEFVCVDANAEPLVGSSPLNEVSTDLYFTETNSQPPLSGYILGACVAQPLPSPFIAGSPFACFADMEVTCVVCSIPL